MSVTVRCLTGSFGEDDISRLLELCAVLFPDMSANYVTDRLPHIASPALLVAIGADGSWLGFKLGYQRGSDLFYSWLGGVHPMARRMGIAGRLMNEQHRWAKERGYLFVETRTRATNAPMLIVNLRAGFEVHGLELDRYDIRIVIQRLRLS